MLSADPFERPSIEEIKESAWYQGDLPSSKEFFEGMSNRTKLLFSPESLETDHSSENED